MTEVPSRELRNRTRAVLTPTVDGRAVAILQAPSRPLQWLPKEEFLLDVIYV